MATQSLNQSAELVNRSAASPLESTPFTTEVTARAVAGSSDPLYLSDGPYKVVQSGWGAVERDRSNGELESTDGKPITLNGTTYAKGLGTHSDSEITYSLGGKYATFIADVGIDDEVGDRGSVTFEVWADGTKLFDSGTITGKSATQQVSVSVAGKNDLSLRVTKGGDSIDYDHADWAGARLVALNTTPTPTTPTPTTPTPTSPTPSSPPPVPTTTLSTPQTGVLQYPLFTKGNQIVDATGKAVQLAGVNWYGINSDFYVPDGLQVRDYKSMLSQMRELGFNMLRLPFSYDSLYAPASAIGGKINYTIGANKELENKRPLEVIDSIVQEAGRQGLMVLLDNQSFSGSEISNLWYTDKYTEKNWIDMWTFLADRYKNQPNVIGADLKNEPHGTATWGTNDLATDWRLASERVGEAILKANPNWLIVVEGVSEDTVNPTKTTKFYWWGENLEGVKTAPVRLSVPNKLVYSPHDYGPGNAKILDIEQYLTYLTDPSFPNNLESRWTGAFGYIHDENTAPVLMGEFGGPGAAYYSREGLWENTIIEYLDRKDMSWAYWAWNPNSFDGVGGVLNSDWTTPRKDRTDLLKPLIDEATPTPKLA